jgi:hypothetical protein
VDREMSIMRSFITFFNSMRLLSSREMTVEQVARMENTINAYKVSVGNLDFIFPDLGLDESLILRWALKVIYKVADYIRHTPTAYTCEPDQRQRTGRKMLKKQNFLLL